jgi:hypothetical protein
LFCGDESVSQTFFEFIFLLARTATLGETFLTAMGWFSRWASGFFISLESQRLQGKRNGLWRKMSGGGCPGGMGMTAAGPYRLNGGTNTRLVVVPDTTCDIRPQLSHLFFLTVQDESIFV